MDFSRKETPKDRGKLTPHFLLAIFIVYHAAMMSYAG